MPTYLLEIGTEELPASHVADAQEKLKTSMTEALEKANVSFESVQVLGTPRRTSCLVRGLALKQSTVKKKVKGPPVKSSFDATGKALPPAVGFAQKQGLTVEQLSREETNGVEYLMADLTIEGKPSAEVLQEVAPDIISQLSGERPMRWGDSELKFSRPIRWIVSLLDAEELKVNIETIESGRETFGNRVLAPEKFSIDHPDNYIERLRKAKVLVDPSERRALIEKQVSDAAEKLAGKARRLDDSLLDEVTNILEWPHAIVGEFSDDYLQLPDRLIETIMVHHQRYFPVERKDDSGSHALMPNFITVANNDRREAEAQIKLGNERVIKARLADGKFFFFEDQKEKLEERKPKLDNLTFQEYLGSYLKKTDRLCLAAKHLTSALMLEPKYCLCIERAVTLCKLDLVTDLVKELPELQGYVGSWYAARESEFPEVVEAIASHYAPRSHYDGIAPDVTGQFVSIIDKLDNLVGLFALGRRPSGSSDPYALRRQSQGLIDTLMDGLTDYRVNVSELMALLMEQIKPAAANKKGFDAAKALTDLSEFLVQRVRSKLLDRGISREVIEAVCSSGRVLSDIPDAVARCQSLQALVENQNELAIVRAGVRIGKILNEESVGAPNEALFENEAEKELYSTFMSKVVSAWPENKFKQELKLEDYKELLCSLSCLSSPVEKFFDNVLVEDPDQKKRDNRRALLGSIYRYFAAIGDFRSLKPLLP